jgi:hypothetical protein
MIRYGMVWFLIASYIPPMEQSSLIASSSISSSLSTSSPLVGITGNETSTIAAAAPTTTTAATTASLMPSMLISINSSPSQQPSIVIGGQSSGDIHMDAVSSTSTRSNSVVDTSVPSFHKQYYEGMCSAVIEGPGNYNDTTTLHDSFIHSFIHCCYVYE